MVFMDSGKGIKKRATGTQFLAEPGYFIGGTLDHTGE
jgi:hypothetical protein